MCPNRRVAPVSPTSPTSQSGGADVVAEDRAERKVGRREFLALSSSWAVVPWLGSLGGLVSAAAQVPAGASVTAPLSVGYLERSDLFSSFDALPWEKALDAGGERVEAEATPLDIYPASELPAGDPSFGWESAQLTIFGLYPPRPEQAMRRVRRAALEVTYRLHDPTLPAAVPFLAWAYAREPVENEGCAVRFTAPVDGELGLSLMLHRESLEAHHARQPARPVVSSLRADFTVNLEAGRPKLQRGIYLLGLRRGLFDRPLTLPGPDELEAARFESLVLSIDHVVR